MEKIAHSATVGAIYNNNLNDSSKLPFFLKSFQESTDFHCNIQIQHEKGKPIKMSTNKVFFFFCPEVLEIASSIFSLF